MASNKNLSQAAQIELLNARLHFVESMLSIHITGFNSAMEYAAQQLTDSTLPAPEIAAITAEIAANKIKAKG